MLHRSDALRAEHGDVDHADASASRPLLRPSTNVSGHSGTRTILVHLVPTWVDVAGKPLNAVHKLVDLPAVVHDAVNMLLGFVASAFGISLGSFLLQAPRGGWEAPRGLRGWGPSN